MKYSEFEFKIPIFEGPLDLMWHLIKKNKIDIYDIPISQLADQFLEYVEQREERSLELSTEFLNVASELFEMKSRMLLPVHSESDFEIDLDNDPRRELIERLLEYRKVSQRRDLLDYLYCQFSNRYFRESSAQIQSDRIKEEKPETTTPEELFDCELLVAAMNRVILKLPEIDTMRMQFFEKLKNMQNRQISVEGKTQEILNRMEIASFQNIFFEDLLSDQSISERIVTFLAVLELMKSGKITATQDNFGISLQIKSIE